MWQLPVDTTLIQLTTPETRVSILWLSLFAFFFSIAVADTTHRLKKWPDDLQEQQKGVLLKR